MKRDSLKEHLLRRKRVIEPERLSPGKEDLFVDLILNTIYGRLVDDYSFTKGGELLEYQESLVSALDMYVFGKGDDEVIESLVLEIQHPYQLHEDLTLQMSSFERPVFYGLVGTTDDPEGISLVYKRRRVPFFKDEVFVERYFLLNREDNVAK